ncbi:lasso peptide biosynthesis PqqD family chaperone [Phytohabitans aurantiacus]|jgi:hypothetical protein|uniref:Coenzyme PQQ synthesis protein D (PqqD) n=1 Tax=Phytohabitans aurantiacus TaxID=3016789 RepID=A0ABQ5QN71_9ACTN|nr:lasso peptide biosynthesis PqqD family chaperone [Phytohabitans aurantiacus]GLH95720.1 hypothetical protein Pa4123_09920 [Phytohabitans aurantiacus]
MGLKLRNGVLITETEYGAALLDEDSGAFFTLNETGAVVVRTIAEGGDAAAAATALSREYDIDRGSAEQDVTHLVTELCTAGLMDR